jgi:hypothetical protein
MRRAHLVALLTIGVLGCSDGRTATAATEIRPTPCWSALDVSVSAGTRPTITWAPGCGVSSVTVTAVGATPIADEVVWGLTVPERAPVGPGIVYGEAPSGASVWAAPRTLAAGVTYRVRVAYVVGGDAVAGAGDRTFTP